MIKVFEAFAGIGTQRMALRNLGIEHEVVAIAEIDKFAIASYEAIHGDVYNLGDISKIKKEDIPDHDLFTYSFPCQDISVAGHGKGLSEGSGTRSGLLWECERIIESKKPKYLLMENVKNLVGKKFKADFDKWLERLEDLGYTNYWQVLNAKDYGIPQNRERVFCVSILNDNQGYKFPEPFELELRLKDLLEDEVEEKFYLSQEQVDKITFSNYNQNKRRIQEKDYSDTLCARDYKDPKCVKVEQIGQYNTPTRDNSGRYRVYDDKGVSPSLTTMGGGNLEPHIINKKVFEQRSDEGARFFNGEYIGTIRAKEAGGDKRVLIKNGTKQGGWRQPHVINPLKGKTEYGWHFEQQVYDENGITRTVKAGGGSGNIPKVISVKIKNGTKQGYLEAREGDGIDLAFLGSKTRRGRVQNQLSQTLDTKNTKGVLIAASRGRQNEDGEYEQRLEINKEGLSNTVTSVQKDNLIIKPKPEFGRMGKQACETANEKNIKHGDTINPFNKNISSDDGISPTLTTRPEGFKTAINVVEKATIIGSTQKHAAINKDGVCPTLTSAMGSGGGHVPMHNYNFRIRKLTPLECWRLMGCSDEDFYKAQKVNSNSQLYKQAGNAIVVDVLEHIFYNLFDVDKNENYFNLAKERIENHNEQLQMD